MNNKDFKDLKKYAKAMCKDKNYMEGYINAMIDYKIINTTQAEELIKINREA